MDQRSPDAAIAVPEGVDGLELGMDDRGLQDGGDIGSRLAWMVESGVEEPEDDPDF
jgi:hypothetical protein